MRSFALAGLPVLLWSLPAQADLGITDFWAVVTEAKVAYRIQVCGSPEVAPLGIYYDRSDAPSAGTKPDQLEQVPASAACPWSQVTRTDAPVGLYRSWAFVDPSNSFPESNEGNNIAGPLEVCVGPDLIVKSFEVQTEGASVLYKATVCNNGSMAGKKFRVGFWHDRAAQPGATEMGDVFKGIVSLAASTIPPDPPPPQPPKPVPVPTCVDVEVPGGLRPNGTFKAWCRVDSGDFELECREGNNGIDPVTYTLNNPDLELTSFQATASGATVKYDVKVCNRGTAAVSKFYVDVYFNRPKGAPVVGGGGRRGQPVVARAARGGPGRPVHRPRPPAAPDPQYAMADPDDFISEPNESNNLSKPLPVQVGTGPSTGCQDLDKDGHGQGPDCKGQQDCDDNDSDIHPGAKEICGDQIDQNCNFTVDDGCPGVDCADSDGDGWGTGQACVLADCDESNKAVHPFAAEVCGDNKDDNCNGIADDGCPGRQCVDQDGDGHGVGKGCPGQQDCSDQDFSVKPGAKEICGDGIDNDCNAVADDGCSTLVDNDGDGWSVGAVSPGPPHCQHSGPAVPPGTQEVCGDGVANNCHGTVDDGCPGVDCKDGDGDGWPAGKDCKVSDCDDNNASVHPWAVEVCKDQIDSNCNGSLDEGCPGVECQDADHDGWPAGKDCKVSDCDDTSAGISPWMQEICGDGKDNNCNSTIDEGCPLCEDADGDGFGVGPKCTSWDCDDADPQSYLGGPEICDGKDNNCNGSVDEQCQGGGGCGCEVGEPRAAGGLVILLMLLAVLLSVARRRAG
jgi:MYXO-CTERM domain-containing protein